MKKTDKVVPASETNEFDIQVSMHECTIQDLKAVIGKIYEETSGEHNDLLKKFVESFQGNGVAMTLSWKAVDVIMSEKITNFWKHINEWINGWFEEKYNSRFNVVNKNDKPSLASNPFEYFCEVMKTGLSGNWNNAKYSCGDNWSTSMITNCIKMIQAEVEMNMFVTPNMEKIQWGGGNTIEDQVERKFIRHIKTRKIELIKKTMEVNNATN